MLDVRGVALGDCSCLCVMADTILAIARCSEESAFDWRYFSTCEDMGRCFDGGCSHEMVGHIVYQSGWDGHTSCYIEQSPCLCCEIGVVTNHTP